MIVRFFKRIRKLFSKKPFKPGDRVRCPNCGAIITLYRWGKNA